MSRSISETYIGSVKRGHTEWGK